MNVETPPLLPVEGPTKALSVFGRVSKLWRADFLSSKDLVRRAAMLVALYVIANLAGLREFTSVLCGTMDSMVLGWRMSAFLGLLYVFVYLGFILVAPMLLIAAGLLAVFRNGTPSK
jgi:hypothetical protein